jgi:hypothetical protein
MIVEQGKHHAVGLTPWFQDQYKERCLTDPTRLRAQRASAIDPTTKHYCARSSMDRASDYGSEGWGFKSLRARQYFQEFN